MTGGLFNPEAFEQMPGQMSMAAVEPSFEGYDYYDCPCGTCGGAGTLTEWGRRKVTCGPCNGTGREFWAEPRGRADR